MTELYLFMAVGALAVIAAVMMLLSENAVHSALFLIVNFACVAFLFLMLEAPFLAMVQIAVYAGAIMVLFLFVIMLLGAEHTTDTTRRLRWLTPAALLLAVVFLVVAGWALAQGQVDLLARPVSAPMLRIIHAAPDVGAVDVFANGELLASNVRFQRATDFVTLEPGEYEIALAPVGQNAAVVSGTFTLEGRPDDPTTPGVDESLTTFTAIAFGTGTDLSLALVPDDLSAINQPRSSRLTIFNAFTGAPTVSLLDFGSTFDENDTRVIIPALEQGALSEPFVLEEGANFATWAFVDDANRILFRLNNPQLFKVERDTTQLVVLMGERLAIDDTLRPVAIPFVTPATPSFGGPHAVGQLLLSRYLLPFELVSILLLVAMIGAVVLTQRVQKPSARRQRGRQVVSRPLTSVLAAQVGKDILKAPTPAAQAAATPADGAGQVAAQEQPQAEEPEPVGD